jgi:hypothetical protein
MNSIFPMADGSQFLFSGAVLRHKRNEMDLDILHANANMFNGRAAEIGDFSLVCRPARMPEGKSLIIDILEKQ